MHLFYLLIYLVLTVSSVIIINGADSSNRLMVVSFDGFRYDYIDRRITPNIHALKIKSTSAKFLLNIFPTQTYPNHFSIATGLYSEHHGVLASEIFDTQTQSLLTYGYKLWHYNESVTPIWTLNEKAGSKSGVMMWPGSNFEFGSINTTFLVKYNSSVPWGERINTVMEWFTNKLNPVSLAMVYFEQPDKDSHPFGPDSPQTNAQIRRVDGIVEYILEQLNSRNLMDINLILLSDHGMEGVTKNRIIDLRPVVGSISKMYGTSPVLQVYPDKGKEEDVFIKLKNFSEINKHFRVYKRKDIPDEFHYKKCTRAPPIMVLAEPEFAFQDLYDAIIWYKQHYSDVTDNNTFGVHGYDPKTVGMHPYFIAHGPLFRKNFEADHLYTVDLYLLFAKILGLKPIYVDGDLNRVIQIFNSSGKDKLIVISVSLAIIGLICGFCVITACYYKKKSKKFHVFDELEIVDEKESVALLEQ